MNAQGHATDADKACHDRGHGEDVHRLGMVDSQCLRTAKEMHVKAARIALKDLTAEFREHRQQESLPCKSDTLRFAVRESWTACLCVAERKESGKAAMPMAHLARYLHGL